MGLTAASLGAVDYQTEIRPLLDKYCWGCHGPKAAMHGLRLDSSDAARKGGDSGAPALVPGKSSESLMIRYAAGRDKDIVMPPKGERLSAAEVDLLSRWIDEGAAYGTEPAQARQSPSRSSHWSFQPIRRPGVPAVRNNAWVRTPIDAFVLARLEEKGWQPSSPATPSQLLRRLHFDLTGLPPNLAAQDAFARDPNIDAAADRLLATPAYGERWGRHWLDLVRYAESNGYERDGVKPEAWRYRDWVIHSFNHDKPFDRFLTEQLAGDESEDANAETLVALGFNRLGPWDDEPADFEEDRFDQLDDIVSTTSQVFLGLTLGCARCHNHKFDPLTARDYYGMVAVFNGLKRPQKGRTELTLPIGNRFQVASVQAAEREFQHVAALAALDFRFLGAVGPVGRDRLDQLNREIASVPRGYFLHEPSAPPKTHLLVRGKASRPGPEVQPGVPAVLVEDQPAFSWPGPHTSLRRLTFARWLASRDNPLTARVIVNRIWQFHFGEALVRSPSDFGKLGQAPTHPELLDWLATWFMDNGWSFKKLHRLIIASNTYRMSKANGHRYAADDPENRLLWRFPYRRLEAEAIRDAMLASSGKLNPAARGPSMFPEIPDAALAGSSDPDKIWKNSPEPERNRRTVYAFLKRSMIVPMLEVLDLCDTARSSAQRMTTSVAPQALTLFNGEFVTAQARAFAGRLRREAGGDPARQVELAYRLALGRRPTPTESVKMRVFLEQQPLEQLTRVILNLNEFVYTD
jgi:hypothetical protein